MEVMVYDSRKARNEIGKDEVGKFRPNLESDCWKVTENFPNVAKLSNFARSRSFELPFQLHPGIAYINNIIYHTNVEVSSRFRDSLNQMVQVQDPQQEVLFSFRLNLRLDLCIIYKLFYLMNYTYASILIILCSYFNIKNGLLRLFF